MKINYVTGFMFAEDLNNVLLIEKDRPEWQKGKLNGIGGKIEEGETALQAMTREFFEETGVYHDMWKSFMVLDGNNSNVEFFYTLSNLETMLKAKQMETEIPRILPFDRIPEVLTVSNLKWVIPMALNILKGEVSGKYSVQIYE